MAKFNKERYKARAEKFSKRIQKLETDNPELRVTGTRGGQSVLKALSNFLSSFGSKLIRLSKSSRTQLLRQDPIENATMRDAAIAKITAQTQKDIENVLNKFSRGKIGTKQLRDQFQSTLRRQALASAIVGVGGIGNLTENVLTIIKRELANQFSYLDGFINDIESRPLNARDRARARQYANSAQSVSQRAAQQFMLDQNGGSADDLEEMRELGGSEHCEDCIELAGTWEPFGTLPPIGQGTVCGTNCNCRIVVRQVTNETSNQQTTRETPIANG